MFFVWKLFSAFHQSTRCSSEQYSYFLILQANLTLELCGSIYMRATCLFFSHHAILQGRLNSLHSHTDIHLFRVKRQDCAEVQERRSFPVLAKAYFIFSLFLPPAISHSKSKAVELITQFCNTELLSK